MQFMKTEYNRIKPIETQKNPVKPGKNHVQPMEHPIEPDFAFRLFRFELEYLNR